MARLFTDGAEMRDTAFWDFSGATTVQNTVPAPFASNYYYRLGSAYKVLPAVIQEVYLRIRVAHSHPSGMTEFRYIANQSFSLGFDGIGRFAGFYSTNPIPVVTGTLVAVPYQWYLVEIYFKYDDAPNGRFVVWIDGHKEIDYTGDTKPAADPGIDNIHFVAGGGFDEYNVDDIAINDTTGGVDDSYCGDGVVVQVAPNDNGTHNQWHGSDLDDVDNYLMCDEFPKDDDVTYCYRDGADSGQQQQFKMDDTYSGTNKTILRIWAEARARKTSADPHTIKLGQLASGGADVVSAGRVLLENGYIRVVGDDSKLNPVTGLPWTEADIDAIEFVAEVG